MRTVILVPRREGIPERDAIWAWCRRRWETEHPDLPIYEGHHDEGPFNRSAAINLASRLADEDGRWNLAVIVDADIFLSPGQVRDAIDTAARTRKVTWAFQRWNGLTQEKTQRLLASSRKGWIVNSPDDIEKTNPISWSCCFVVPREIFDALGGFDERFAGWGWEDLAFQSAVCGLYGHERLDGDLYHLWHPRHPGLGDDGVNKRRNRQLGRRYMYALRVLGLHDRPAEATEEEMERDRQNTRRLALQEESDRLGRPAPDLPDWRDWWPSLEHLVETWKARTSPGPRPRVSMIVRTGGRESTWPTRREYLVRSLESLTEHVSYDQVVRRVIYSDWPAAMRPELDAIAERFGFYVVGEGNLGYTASMQRMWRYIASRQDAFEYVFLAEDDFTYDRPVDLAELIGVLEANPQLTQMALLRDACYQSERDKGGILGWPEGSFTPAELGTWRWLEHRNFWTANPSLFRRSLATQAWPSGRSSERLFADGLFRSPTAQAAFWGQGESWITHIGEVRAGAGY